MTYTKPLIASALALLFLTPSVEGKSSSLYRRPRRPAEPASMINGRIKTLAPSVAASSLVAVTLPPPKKFTINDLVTIIVRESTSADSKATLETEKEVSLRGQIQDWPNMRLHDLVDFQLTPSTLGDGPIRLGIEYESEFDGEGKRRRTDQFETRVTARIADIKPNGTMVLEARKYIKTDKETVRLLVTGTCRPGDIGPANTVLSTALYDLHVTNEHSGELYQALKKGIFTKFLELLFNF